VGLKNQPEFETETDIATATKENTVTTENTIAADVASAQSQASTAIATAQTRAVGAPAKKLTLAFAEQQNVFDTATVEGLSMASPRIKGEQGSLFMGEKDLGSKIRFELVSWNKRWAIGTGTDDKEAKDYFRVSYDNQTISGDGGSVSDYIEGLKAEGFSKAKASPYGDLFGFITWSEKDGEIAVDERQLCILQASQTSLGAFVSFCTTRGLLQSKGVAQELDEIEVHAEKRVSGSNKYTNFSFHAPKK
jgi:hypothetical protein